MRRERHVGRVAIYAVLGIAALFFLAPTVLVVLTSFKDLDDLRRGNMLGLPSPWTVAPWAKAWSGACTGVLARYLRGTRHAHTHRE